MLISRRPLPAEGNRTLWGMDQQQANSSKLSGRPFVWGVLVFLLAAAICALLAYLEMRIRRNESDKQLYSVAESVRSRLQQSLQYSLSATQTMALTINREGVPVNFDSVARYVLSYNKFIDALQLAPNGVIEWVYPLESNEVVVGYDVLSDPLRRTEALKALERNELFFAGPFRLKQGGLGVVGRLPVYKNGKFWGFSAVVIRMNTLLVAAGVDTTGESGYYYQLSKINPATGEEELFLPVHTGNQRSYDIAVTVPDGAWKLSVTPVNPEATQQSTWVLAALGLLLSILAGVFVYNRSKYPTHLNRLVQERTQELNDSLRRNNAIMNAIPDIMLVIGEDDRFIDYNNPLGHPTLLKPEEFLGKRVDEVLPDELVPYAHEFKEKALQQQKVLTHSYTLPGPDGNNRHYEARYSPQSQTEVLVLVRDVTDASDAAERIKESESKYRTLVEQAGDAIFIATLKGEIQVVNSAACRMSQYSYEELSKMSIYELTPKEELESMPYKLDELALGETVVNERKLLRKDGTIVEVEVTAKMISNDRFLAFARDISERKRVQSELLRSREDLRKLSNYIEKVREEERLHISREIHDELGQHLTVLKMDVSRLGKKAVAADESLAKDFKDVLDALNDMVLVVRRISTELRPGMLDDLGLVAAIDWYVQDFEKKSGIKTGFLSNLGDHEFSREQNIGIFRILQESLTNVARHSRATKTDVSLVEQDGQIVLLIEDNGVGFDNNELVRGKTLGILGMKERAIMMGGTYQVNSGNGRGTVVEVVLPK